ncbi:MAG TPA: sulfatase-like hydrolase/transferase [Vicinamibacterales bacterium]|nr:sulfatase-like hydrolase/transferase [Vicinamibacterales bacterium]
MATRRTLAVLAVAALIIVAAAGLWWRAAKGRTEGPRFVETADQNVLLITIDTLRADALGSYGGRAATPNLDRLAAEGIRFTFAHAHAVVTLPSHASIMTGRYPYDHGVRDNAGYRLDDKAKTLAELAEGQGLATGAFVGAFPLDRQFGLAQGFATYDDVGGRESSQADFAFTERRAEQVVSAARQWIDSQKGRWLAWVHLFDPHASYTPPPPFDAQYRGNEYAGEVAYVDHALGPLLEAARRGPRPTTIIVTADHGEGLGEHGELTHGTFAYEGTLRVPLIVAQVSGDSGAAEGGTRGHVSDAPVRHVDIVPTIARLLQFEPPAGLPGAPVLAARMDDPRPAYFEAMTPMLARGWAPLSGLVTGREKYIDLPIEELYDLGRDPREEQNLVAKSGERTRALAAELRRFSAALPGAAQDETAEVRQRLQALGYVSGSAPRKATYTEEDDPKRLIDVDRLMMDGIDLYRRGRMPEAMDAYRRVIVRRPEMGLAYRRLAFLQWQAGAPAEAIATLRSALQKTGPDIDIEIRLGTYLAESGAAAEAIPVLEKVASADARNPEALNALGIAYARHRRPADALRTFSRAIEVNPRDLFAQENIGTVHLQQGNLSAAREAFERALRNDDASSRAHAGLGVVARQQQRIDEAISHWRRAVELDRTNYDALFNLARELASAGRHAEARPYAVQFVQTAPPAFYGRDIEQFRRYLSESR